MKSDLTSRRVLVTGAGGFIGSHLTEALVRAGADVRAFVHYNALGSAGWLDHSAVRGDVELVFGDIADSDSVLAACRGIDIVFHLAALIAIPYSYVAPRAYVRANVEGTLNVLQAARECGISLVLQTSTSEVYGTARIVPIPETHPLQGQSPYSASKIGADKLAESYFLSFGTPVVTVRPFNTFGPRQSLRAVIPTVIRQGLQGGVIRLGNVSPTRDFNYVSNTVDAFLMVAQRPDLAGQTVHFGSGREISVGDMVKIVVDMLGHNIDIVVEDERLRRDGSEVERLIADDARARELVGWSPSVSLEEGLKRTVEWFREFGGRGDASRYTV